MFPITILHIIIVEFAGGHIVQIILSLFRVSCYVREHRDFSQCQDVIRRLCMARDYTPSGFQHLSFIL